MIRKIAGILANIFLGFLTCPCLLIFITNIQGTAKGLAYTIPEVERGIYTFVGSMILFAWIVILMCCEIAIFKFLFKKNLTILCWNIVLLFVTIFVTLFMGIWD